MAHNGQKQSARRDKAPPEPERRLPGPRSAYRHKVRAPKAVLLTQAGHEKLNQDLQRCGRSVSDYYEYMTHHFGHKVPPVTAAELEQAATR